MPTLIIGSRGSPLALVQSHLVRDALLKAHPDLTVEIKVIKTSGDQFVNLSLAAGAGKGLFTKEIEEQLANGSVQLAVHSLKDLPTAMPDSLTIGAVLPRADARDVLVTKTPATLDDLPSQARIATSSIRRRAQLLARRPDFQVEEIRGNVETRLHKLLERDALNATILAAAGLKRLGIFGARQDLQWQVLEPDVMIPAVGQGAIAIEVREQDYATQELLAPLNHAETMACTMAERAFLHAMGGGCQVPFAAHAVVAGDQIIRLLAATFSADGKESRRTTVNGPLSAAAQLGQRAARELA